MTMSRSTESPALAPAPSTNGALVDRVQQLRLDGQLGRGSGGGTGRGSWLPWVLCGLMAVAWVGVGVKYLRRPAAPEGGGPVAGGPAGNASGTTGAPPGPGQGSVPPGELVLPIKGTVTPFLQINLSPDDVSGVVEQIFFKEGDRVARGKVLARIRKDRYQNDFNSTTAAVQAAQAQILKATKAVEAARSRVHKATATLERAVLDLERARNNTVTARATIDEAEANKKIAEAEKKVAELDVASAEAALTAAQHDATSASARSTEAARLLANTEVKAPIDGTILTKSADRGVLVSPMSFNVASGICSMADLSQLEVEIDVPERQFKRVKPGMDCVVQADADPSRAYRGVVDRVMPTADDTKNVVKVRVRVYLARGEEAGSFLIPKMSATVSIYNRPFTFNPETDQPWVGEKK